MRFSSFDDKEELDRSEVSDGGLTNAKHLGRPQVAAIKKIFPKSTVVVGNRSHDSLGEDAPIFEPMLRQDTRKTTRKDILPVEQNRPQQRPHRR